MIFRVDFEVSLSQHEGDPSDFIMVYEGKVIGMLDDDRERKIGNLTIYYGGTWARSERRNIPFRCDGLPGRRQLRLFCEPLRPQNRATEARRPSGCFLKIERA